MVLTILVMGLIIIPASAASSTAQRVAAMLQQQRGAIANSPGGAHSLARAIPGSGASASAGCSNQAENAAIRFSPCGTQAFAPVGRQVEREQAVAVPSAR
ncbi:MAG: hypothetical protein WB443_05045 [Nitrososphaeraceae archaeon]